MILTDRQLKDALRYLRVPAEGCEQMLPLVRAGFAELSSCIQPRTVWQCFKLVVEIDGITLGDASVHCVSRDLVQLFRNCHACIVAAVTLGLRSTGVYPVSRPNQHEQGCMLRCLRFHMSRFTLRRG